jgi:hypothetical protein
LSSKGRLRYELWGVGRGAWGVGRGAWGVGIDAKDKKYKLKVNIGKAKLPPGTEHPESS